MLDLITAGNGTEHVQSADDGAVYAGILGQGCYVLQGGDGVSCTMTTANEATIGTGVGCIYGRMWRLPTTQSVTIDSGTQSQRRHDIICVHYSVDEGGVETGTLDVIKGTPTTAAEATDPDIPGGSILDGATESYMPLWRIPLDGISVGEPERLFETLNPVETISEAVETIPKRIARYATAGQTSVFSSGTRLGTSNRYYVRLMTAEQLQQALGHTFARGRDFVLASNGDVTVNSSIPMGCIGNANGLLLYLSSAMFPVRIDWALLTYD